MDERAPLFVTLEGYAVEGGYDRAFEPATCYSPMIALGHVAGPGDADGLWRDYESVIDALSQTGIAGVRLTPEWARIEPRRGRVDESALERYRQVVDHARSRDLRVVLALVDRAWPSWLGLEAWLLPWVVPHVLEHARRVLSHLGSDVDGIVSFADRDALVRAGYLKGSGPPWRRDASVDAAFAGRQIDQTMEQLGADPDLGPRLITSFATTSLEDVSEIERLRRGPLPVHVRAAVAGHGPSAVSRGLLVRSGDGWRVDVDQALLEALR